MRLLLRNNPKSHCIGKFDKEMASRSDSRKLKLQGGASILPTLLDAMLYRDGSSGKPRKGAEGIPQPQLDNLIST